MQDEAVCISRSTYTLRKDKHPTIFPIAMGKIGQTGLFNHGMVTDL